MEAMLDSPSSSRMTASSWRYSLRLLLALPLAVALWLTVHFSADFTLTIIFELLTLMAFTSSLLSVIVFGNELQRGFALGAILSPLGFLAFAFRHSPFDGAMLAMVSGDRLGPLVFDLYSSIWWVPIWLPTSLVLGIISLLTQKLLIRSEAN
jgi:hypothetical protein